MSFLFVEFEEGQFRQCDNEAFVKTVIDSRKSNVVTILSRVDRETHRALTRLPGNAPRRHACIGRRTVEEVRVRGDRGHTLDRPRKDRETSLLLKGPSVPYATRRHLFDVHAK